MADHQTTAKPAWVEDARPGYKRLMVFGVAVQATGTPSLWPAMERLAEAINVASGVQNVR